MGKKNVFNNLIQGCLVLSLIFSQLVLVLGFDVQRADAFVFGATCVQDQQGADDIAEPADINQFCHTTSNTPIVPPPGGSSGIYLSWDNPSPTSSETRACVLVDTNNNGLSNYAFCATRGPDAGTQSASGTMYACNDTVALGCGSPTNVTGSTPSFSCAMQSSHAAADPFGGGGDTSMSCAVIHSETASMNSSRVVYEACSFATNLPNSEPLDCIVAAPNMATVTVTKDVNPDSDPGLFDLKINGTEYATDAGDGGTTGPVTVSSNAAVVVLEEAGTNTVLTDYTTNFNCVNQNQTVVASGDRDGINSRQVTIRNNRVNEGDVINCVITNDRIGEFVTISKRFNNNYGGTTDPSAFSFVISGYNNDQPIQFEADGTNQVFLPLGNYSVTEVPVPGYEIEYSRRCANIVVDGDAQTRPGSCAITNSDTPAVITINKTVINDHGGTAGPLDFTFSLDDITIPNADFQFTGPLSITTTKEVAAGPHQVTEQEHPDYTATYSEGCDTTLAVGQEVTCDIVNDDKPAKLVVRKVVRNDHGGQLGPENFSFIVNGNTNRPISFNANGNAMVQVPAGTYNITEVPVPGYNASYEGCQNIDLSINQRHVCTITNDDKPAKLKIIKTVTNDDGNDKGPLDFEFKVNGRTVPSGHFNQTGPNTAEAVLMVPAGGYNVTEAEDPAYNTTYSDNCSNLRLGLGDRATCVINNDDKPTRIIVHKKLVNDNGGDMNVTDFEFFLNNDRSRTWSFRALDEENGRRRIKVKPGAYNVTEVRADGYEVSYDNCRFKIDFGQTHHCYITNDDKPPVVKVTKVTNPWRSDQDFRFRMRNAGEFYDRFTLNASSPSTSMYVTDDDLQAGRVRIVERDVEGWYEGRHFCVNQNQNRRRQRPIPVDRLRVDIGERWHCVFINNEESSVDVTKFHDYNENGVWDEGEPTLEDWEMTLERVNRCNQTAALGTDGCHNDNVLNQAHRGGRMLSELTNEDGVAEFDGLRRGYFKVDEVVQDGWTQTGIECDTRIYDDVSGQSNVFDITNFNIGDLFDDDGSNGVADSSMFFLRPGQHVNCTVGNIREPLVSIEKTNNLSGPASPGDEIEFTLEIEVPPVEESGALHDPVTVVDNLSDEFDYVPNSFSAESSERGDLVGAGVTSDPNYASPGTWILTNASSNVMVPGEIVTLRYRAIVGANTPAGTYATTATVTGFGVNSTITATDTDGNEVVIQVPQVLGISIGDEITLVNTGSKAILTMIVGLTTVSFSLFLAIRKPENN